MGATTWTYPEENISLETFFSILYELRNGFNFAYSNYINKLKNVDSPPIIGKKWPKEGNYVPSLSVFITEINKRASPETMLLLSRYLNKTKNDKAKESLQ